MSTAAVTRPLLAFDCSGPACSVAVARDGEILARCFEARPRGHGERLLPMAAEVLREARCGYSDLRAVAVTLGPGSFTGLRIGLATARALALAAGLPVIGRSSFEVLAAAALADLGPGEQLLVAIDSQRGDLFLQEFSEDGRPAGEPFAASAGTVGESRSGPLLLAGSGAERLAEALAERGTRCRIAAEALLPDAAVLARLASLAPLPPPGSAPPAALYLRPPDTTQPEVAKAGTGKPSDTPCPPEAPRIRPLRATDLGILAALHRSAFPHDPWDERAFAELLAMPGSRGWLLALGEPERPAGFLLIRCAADEAEILTFGVDPGHRRRGLGGALLDFCLEALADEGIATLFLEVALDNRPARRLYEARSFTVVGRRPRYLTGPEGPLDALILARRWPA